MLKPLSCPILYDDGQRCERTGITQDRVLQELTKVGFATIRNAITKDEDGQPQISLATTPLGNLDAMSEVQTETVLERNGTDEEGKPKFSRVRKTKIKFYDKMLALEKLARRDVVYDKEAEHASDSLALALVEIQNRTSIRLSFLGS